MNEGADTAKADDLGVLLSDRFFEGISWTPAIETAAQLVALWVSIGVRGAAFWGLPCVGKSEFAKYLEKVAHELFGDAVVVVRLRFVGNKFEKRPDLIRRAASALGIRAISSRDDQSIRNRIMDDIRSRCSLQTRFILVILDEVQNIKPEVYGEFSYIESEIGESGYRSLFLSIGQPELQSTVTGLQNDLHYTGRQYQKLKEFRGLTFDEIEAFLASLEGDDLRFSKKHFQARAARGWSVVELVKPIRQAVMSLSDLDGLNRELFFPMSYLRQTLNYLFFMLDGDDAVDVEVTSTMVLEAFDVIGFDKLMHAYAKPVPPERRASQ